SDLWIADAEVKEPRVLLDETGFAVDPEFTPDGKFLIFNLQKDRRSRIWRANADGSDPRPLTPDNPDNIDFNPEVIDGGRTVIFQRQNPGNERFMLMKVSIDGGEAEIFYQNEEMGIFAPRVSRDGRRLAFTSYDLKNFTKKLHTATIDGNQFG